MWDGPLKVLFKGDKGELKIEKLEIAKDEFTEFIPQNKAKLELTPPLSNRSTSPEAKRSPMDRTALGQMAGDIRGGSDHGEERFPKSVINEMGLPVYLMRFLEVCS